MHKVKMNLPAVPGEHSELEVDGEDIFKQFRVRGLVVSHVVGEVTTVTVEIAPVDVELNGEALMEMGVPLGAAVVSWLGTVSPQDLVDRIGAILQENPQHSYEQICLDALIAMAREETEEAEEEDGDNDGS